MIARRTAFADDRGIADAFYTVLSAGIVLLAGLAISSVVLNTATHQSQAVADRLDAPGGTGLKKGLYTFYYATDQSADFSSADPGRIPPGSFVTLCPEPAISLSKANLPPGAPAAGGMAIWAGYIYVDRTGDYAFELESVDGSWLWVDGILIADNHGIHPKKSVYSASIRLAEGRHTVKARYFYTVADNAWCHVLIGGNGSRSEPAFYR
jgi:PA14 domain